MHREARANSRIVARLEPGVVVEVKTCDGDWCEADATVTAMWHRARSGAPIPAAFK
jgi:SH3-like domain-containing protein